MLKNIRNDLKRNFAVASKLTRKPAIIPALFRNYFRLMILRKKVLRNLQLAILYDCNYKCPLCATKHLKKAGPPLDIKQISRLVKEAKDLGCININLTGGEPLLHPELEQIIRIISENGLMTGLITNGHLLEYNLLKRLKTSGLTELAISVHGNEAYHDNFTGIKLSYRKAVESIEMAKDNKMSIVINTVITHDNLNSHCIDDIKRLARHYNIFIQPILICFPNKDLINSSSVLDKEDLRNFEILLKDPFIKPLHRNYFGSFCPAGDEYIYIGAYGDVFMCDLLQIPFGNIIDEPLANIWQRMLDKRKHIGYGHICVGLGDNS
mgnify:CR=1 FL=1